MEQEKADKDDVKNRLFVRTRTNKRENFDIEYFKNNVIKQTEINQRRKLIQQHDAERKKNEKLSDIDRMAQEEAEYLLKKANELRQEEEDEIKRLNEVCFFSTKP